MRKLVYIFALILIGGTLNAQSNIQNINYPDQHNPEYVNGDILIKFKSIPGQKQAVEQVKTQLISSYKSNVVKQWKMGAEHWKVDTLVSNYNFSNILDSLNSNSFVEYAEPNYIIRADVIPNDPSFGDQWALNNTGQSGGTPDADIDAVEAWDITTGDTNIVVGIIDTGIDYEHEDLEDNIWTNWDEIPNNGIDDDNNGYIDDIHGWDFYNNDNDPMDDYFHGTHVAGTIGVVSNNGIGVAGVAWKVRMMALKFMDVDGYGSISGTISGAVSAVEYATANGVKLTNNSWGGEVYSQTMFDAIASANTAGVLFIASAGNDYADTDINPHYPACYDLENIISVASTDRNDSLSGFSNYGLNTVDIAAPGSVIYSTMPNNTYGNLSGTSMAAPHVSGTAVLTWAAFPGFNHHQIKQQLLGSGDQLENLTEEVSTSCRVNAFNAVVDTNFLPLSVTPRELNFLVAIIGTQSNPQKIILTNILNSTLTIDSIMVEDGYLISKAGTYSSKITLFNINSQESDSINVVFNPGSPGSYSKQCNIYYTTNSATKKIQINLFGYGTTSGTLIPGGDVSGIWDSINSPYYILGDINVSTNQTLKVNPGVEVLFAGHFKLEVEPFSHLIAKGNQSDSITFSSLNKNNGWHGIRFYNDTITDTLQYCIFSDAKKTDGVLFYVPFDNADAFGAAVYIESEGFYYTTKVITNNTFKSNSTLVAAAGGALACFYGSIGLLLRDNNFVKNENGAVYIEGSRDVVIFNNYFCGNTGTCIGVQHDCNVIIANNIIAYNGVGVCGQGGIYCWGNAKVSSVNNTIINNSTGLGCTSGGEIYLCNTILTGNGTQISASNSQNIHAFYSNIAGGYQGSNIIDTDPLFINNPGGIGAIFYDESIDLHLNTNSPCIDQGDPGSLYLDEDSTWNDMGAYGGSGLIFGCSNINFKKMGTRTMGFGDNNLDFSMRIFNGRDDPFTIENYFTETIDYLLPNSNDSLIIDSQYLKDFIIRFKPNQADTLRDTVTLISTDFYDTTPGKISLCGIGVDATVISGYVFGTLGGVDSSYLVADNLTVHGFDTLFIEPGTILYFADDAGFYAAGYLYARGTRNNKITFTRLNSEWPGINIQDGELTFCVVEYSNQSGITSGTWTNDYEINNCIIRNNSSRGLYMRSNDNPKISNNLIFNNGSSGISTFQNAEPIIANNTITKNGYGGIQIYPGSNPILINNINWGNNWSNTTIDPHFVDYANNDFHLSSSSPCIDAGINDSVFSSTDLDGNFRIWDGDTNGIAIVDMGAYEYGSPEAPVQEIELDQGWNIFSSYVEPLFNDMLDVLDPMISLSFLIKAIDESGGFVQYIPGMGWMNTIDDIENTEGYYIKATDNTSFSMVGTSVALPFDIPLQTGWNIMGYPVSTSQDAMTVINQLITPDSTLIKVIDEAGGFIQYIPGFGWMNTINSLTPGEGYYIKVNANDTLILSEPSKAYTPTQKPKISKPGYFLSNNLNPYNPMNFVITKIVGEGFDVEDGDEIAVYDGNIKVGSAIINANYKGLQLITTRADDPLTEIIDGFIEGNNISFKYWDKSDNAVYNNIKLDYSSGDSLFINLETFVGELKIFTTEIQEIEIPETIYLGQNYPNPFTNETIIEYGITNEGKVLLSIYDVSGREVKTLINKHQTQGNYSVTFDRSTLKPGVYYYEIIVSDNGVIFSDVKKMIVE